MRGLKELPHSCFSFLLQISSEPFSVKDYQLIQYLIPVPVSLCPFPDYVFAGKIQHLFQCCIAWKYTLGFCDFPVLTVQSLYDVSCVHNTSDIIWKLEKGTYIFPIIFPSSFTRATYSLILFDPSSKLYSVWTCKCVKLKLHLTLSISCRSLL